MDVKSKLNKKKFLYIILGIVLLSFIVPNITSFGVMDVEHEYIYPTNDFKLDTSSVEVPDLTERDTIMKKPNLMNVENPDQEKISE